MIENDQFKEYLISISGGSIPATYDHDSHYVINMRLTFDILKKLNDIKFVLEICGDYTGTVTSVGAAREYRPEDLVYALETQEQFKTPIETEKELGHANDADDIHHLANLNTITASEDPDQPGIPLRHKKNYVISNSLKMIFCILFTAAGATSLVNLVIMEILVCQMKAFSYHLHHQY
jgi:hypothetical protein